MADKMEFNPLDFPDLFELTDDGRIVYKKTNRGGKPKSYVWSDPEEKVRAEFYGDLVMKYKYPADRIDLEVEVYRRKPEDFADIVVYEDDGLTKPFLVVECKEPNVSAAEFEQAIKQAWGNANNLGTKYAATVAGSRQFAFEPRDFDIRDREKYAIIIPERYDKPIKYRYVKGDPNWDLKPGTLDELRKLFQRCHDILWENGRRNPAQAFDEMSKLMFCKFQDERHGTPDGETYKFQVGTHESPTEVAKRIQAIYDESRARMPNVFRSQIEVSDELIYRVVEVLQTTSLSKSDLDAKGRAFETFCGTVFRGEMGQYFTPRTIVEFIVEMVNPTTKDRVIDPACGSGGFLLYALDRVQREAERLFKDVISRRDYWKDWALRSLHGVEISDQISRVAMMGMILHEDGYTNIVCADALQAFDEMKNITSEYQPERFSVLMTNPPFGGMIQRVTKKAKHPYLDAYELGSKVQSRNSQKSEILFLERCLELLEPRGRAGIVLPEGIFNNPSLAYVRRFVEDRAYIDAVVSLPVETFASSGPSVKSSVLFLRKFTKEESARFAREKELALSDAIAKYKPERDALIAHYSKLIACYGREELQEKLDDISVLESEDLTGLDKDARQQKLKLIANLKRAFRNSITSDDRARAAALRAELNRKLSILENKITQEARRMLKKRLSYPVFMAHVEHVGITSNGQSDTNELPNVVQTYRQFRQKNPLRFPPVSLSKEAK